MPYIDTKQRKSLGEQFVNLPDNAGELNYVLTKVIFNYYLKTGAKYQQINDILGALEGAKLEFYRRIVIPYEDKKILENGDVY